MNTVDFQPAKQQEDLTKLAGEEESRELLVSSILSLGCLGNRKNKGVETVKLVTKKGAK